jgi:hypothetical protein
MYGEQHGIGASDSFSRRAHACAASISRFTG